MSISGRLLLATTNPAKLAKLRWLLEGTAVEPVTPQAPFEAPEVGRTHQENAEAKALAWSRHFEMPAIASDGGLVIPALGEHWDALFTARFAGPEATDRDRLARLLDLMRPYTGAERTAFWREAIAVAAEGRVIASWHAESQPGLLGDSYDAKDLRPGFWAFTIWRIPELGRAYSQLTPAEIDHLEDHWGLLRRQVREWSKRPDTGHVGR